MSAELGPQTSDRGREQEFLGKDLFQGHRCNEAAAARIDNEVARLLYNARETAKSLIHENRKKLTLAAELMMMEETIHASELRALVAATTKTVPVKT